MYLILLRKFSVDVLLWLYLTERVPDLEGEMDLANWVPSEYGVGFWKLVQLEVAPYHLTD